VNERNLASPQAPLQANKATRCGLIFLIKLHMGMYDRVAAATTHAGYPNWAPLLVRQALTFLGPGDNQHRKARCVVFDQRCSSCACRA